jgi:hypothetical protein
VAASGGEAEQAYRVTALTEPEDTEELTILIAGEAPESLNPWRDPSDLELILFPRAIRRNPESLEWEPWMAESWQVAEDRRSVEATIRDGSLWSDGEAVTAADWVLAANRYFNDPGLRTPYRDAPEYAGLEPRWEAVGELRFRIHVARATDEKTLLSLLYLPPLPPSLHGGAKDRLRESRELNALWRLSSHSRPEEINDLLALLASAGAYELDTLEVGGAGELFTRLRRRSGHREPEVGVPAADSVSIRYVPLDRYVDMEPRELPTPPDLIYVADSGGGRKELAAPQTPPEEYRLLLAGSDLTPALLLLSPRLQRRGELVDIARSVAEEYVRERGLLPRYVPPPLDGERLFASGAENDGSRRTEGGDSGVEAGSLGDDAPSATESLRFLLPLEEPHLGYAESFREAAGERGFEVSLEPVASDELATALLAGEQWGLMLLEIREPFDPLLGDPFLGNALPLTGEWSRPASGLPPRSLSATPFSSAELGSGEFPAEELAPTVIRLWRNVAASPREADRSRGATVLERLWVEYQPWLYLYDEERRHFVRRGVENVILRHLPGAELGTVLPYIYRRSGGAR